MRLVDLAPKWAVDGDIVIGGQRVHYEGRRGMGITFACPHCVALHPGVLERGGAVTFLGVWFSNPIDGLPPESGASYLWQRTGESFDTLTLSPSIDAQTNHGHWHGFIQNGVIS